MNITPLKTKKAGWQALVAIAVLLFLLLFIGYQSFRTSSRYGGTDLRARVVGARLLLTNHSPYFYTWQSGDPQQWLDPNLKPGRKVNGNVVTPAVLLVMQPLVLLPYKYIRPVWTLLELLAALFTIYLLVPGKSLQQMAGYFLLPLLLFLAGPYWQFHTDRGQMYIFYTTLMAGSWFVYPKGRYGKFWSGFLAGLLVFMRPFAICFAIPFLAAPQREWLKGFSLALFTGILVWVVPLQKSWKEYADAMKMYSAELTGMGEKEAVSAIALPAEIEQMTNLAAYGNYPVNAFPTTFELSGKWGMAVPQWASYGLLLGAIALVIAIIFFKKIRTPEKLFTCGFLLMMGCEYTTYAPRAPYNLLLWLAPVCLWLTAISLENRFVKWGGAVILFLMLHPQFTFQKSFGFVAELCFLLLGLIFVWYSPKKGTDQANSYPISFR